MLASETTHHQDRIDADGPALSISAQVVQPIALVLHEMLSNAVAHGALAQQDGAITVRWRAENDQAILSWRERGGVTPPCDPQPGFGLSMIEGVIGRQLGGTASFGWTSAGLQVELAFPRSGRGEA